MDEHLRRVPFIETRATAKEAGATVGFRKSEGIASVTGAEPDDYVYIDISGINDDMSGEEAEIQVDRVDGGLVYRAELEEDYNVSTLEPVVGPDGSDPAEVADETLLNVDNVYVMDDGRGRVLCCEDVAQYGRSWPNDCLYVYTPAEAEPNADDGEDEGENGGRETKEPTEDGTAEEDETSAEGDKE